MLSAGVAQSAVGGNAEGYTICKRHFPVEGAVPATSEEDVSLVKHGQDCPDHKRDR